jgi:hypothetical protein
MNDWTSFSLSPFLLCGREDLRTAAALVVTGSFMNKVKTELLLLLSLFVIAATLQFFAESLPMALCFYFLPTLYSAYFFGRSHATQTAFACVFMVVLLNFVGNFLPARTLALPGERLFNFAIWAGMLAVTGYAMGTLYERKESMTNDIRESFSGLLVVLQHFLENEQYTQGKNLQVLELATKTANVMGLGEDRVELLRSAILLRDLSQLGITHDMLYKAADVNRKEIVASFTKKRKPDLRAQAMGGSLRRVIPIIVAEQILEEQGARSVNVPIEAHILAVADSYLSLTTAPEGKAISSEEAESMIAAASGEKYQSGVVDAFMKAREGAFGASAGA